MTKLNYKLIAGIAGWAIIFTAVIAGTGFYFGQDYAKDQQAHTDQIIKAAQASPAPVAALPKQ